MAFDLDIPTLSQVVNRAAEDVNAELGTEFALLDDTPERVLAKASGGLAFGVYGKENAIARNIVPGRENDEIVLEQWASLWLGNNEGKKPARPAEFPITGTGTPPVAVPAGTTFRREDGALYITEIEIEWAAETQSLVVISSAVEGEPGFGADGNTIPGSTLTLISVVPGLDADWVVDGDPAGAAVGAGVDEESHDALADRVTFRAQNPPRGGGPGDYVAWALEVPGVAQAWENVGAFGSGTVGVFIVRDDIDSPLPDALLVQETQAYLDQRVPLGQVAIVRPPALIEIDMTIEITPDTQDVRDSIRLSLRDAIARRGEPETTFRRSWLTEAISLAEGEEDHTLVVPADDVPVGDLELPTLGDITFSEKTD